MREKVVAGIKKKVKQHLMYVILSILSNPTVSSYKAQIHKFIAKCFDNYPG